ncbi:NAD(P)/FAD-dependent oxidoreductase [Alicyclobacillaceae bacterium I2511]|nr:NAD(P)/FAD-dependent oxidoreductase [Alicyclobacillaceae bacterium I2511]
MGTSPQNPWDVLIIGGGPAGLMASISAQETGAHTILVEKGLRLGRKLAISGGGRCNVTNAKPLPEFMENVLGNPRFTFSALHRFSNQDVQSFFEVLGIQLKEEDRGRVFPVSDKAATVVHALVDYAQSSGVTFLLETPVTEILSRKSQVCGVQTRDGPIWARTVVVATGGCSVPQTGSSGDAYPWARQLGHRVVEPYPTEVPITSDTRWITEKLLQGISLRDVTIQVRQDKKKVLTTERGDLLFTHFGLSGPVALRCSHYISTALRKDASHSLWAIIDTLPNTSVSELEAWLLAEKFTSSRRYLSTLLTQRLPERLVDVVLEQAQCNGHQPILQISDRIISTVCQACKQLQVHIVGTLPLAKATVTGGGIATQDINPRTMESKRCEGLFFAGEVMDIHAHTGGYNITLAFSTGHLAGQQAALMALATPVPENNCRDTGSDTQFRGLST